MTYSLIRSGTSDAGRERGRGRGRAGTSDAGAGEGERVVMGGCTLAKHIFIHKKKEGKGIHKPKKRGRKRYSFNTYYRHADHDKGHEHLFFFLMAKI